jgi:SAM-dependent methyltransferase
MTASQHNVEGLQETATAGAKSLRDQTAALITGCWSTQVIHVAVKLGLIDRLANQPADAAALATALGTQPRATFRLLRALTTLGLCRQSADGAFELTEAGQFLRTGAPQSLRNLAQHWGGRTWSALAHLEDSIKTGAAWQHSGREGFFSMADNPEQAAIFNRTMVSQTVQVAREIVDAYDFSRFKTVADIGGGYGALLAALLKRYPRIQGWSGDLAYMEPDALAYLQQEGVADRGRFVPTDFFKSVQSGADAYLLKYIIHDWDDEDSIALLRNVRAALGPNGVVLIIERIVPEQVAPKPDDVVVIRGDIQMLVAAGGLERTEAEYRNLLEQSGLRLVRTVPTSAQFSLIEAVAAGV